MKTMSLDNNTLEATRNWYYDKKQLRTTPSSTVGISYETESRYRGEGARFIFDIGNKLGLSRDTIATGVVYFHRFYMFHSFKDFPRYVTACSSLFLAGKVEETPKKSRDIIKTARSMLTDVQFAQFGKDPRREVATLEKILLKTMKFDLDVDHPYTFLLRYAKSLKGSQQRVQNMVQMAWYFINDSYSTTLCLQWEPEIIAIAFMSLACKLSRFSVTDWSGRLPSHTKWWDKFVENISHDILQDINGQLLSLYSKSKQPSPLSLPHSKMLKRPAPDQLVPEVETSSQLGANVQDVKPRPVSKSSTHKSNTHVAAPPAKKARTTSPPNVMGSLDKMPLSENLNIVKPPEPNNMPNVMGCLVKKLLSEIVNIVKPSEPNTILPNVMGSLDKMPLSENLNIVKPPEPNTILPNVTGSLDKMPLSENLNNVKPPEPNTILPNVMGSLDKMPLSGNLNIVKPPEPNTILPNVMGCLVKKLLSEIVNIVKPTEPNTILPNVKGSLDKMPLSENLNIVKPPKPNNNLPGLPTVRLPESNFLYPSYQQQAAVRYQDPYVSATEGAATGNQYLPQNYHAPNQQYQQPDGTYPTPPSVNAATANQVPMRPPPPPMNASVIPNVPHSPEFQQLPAPDAASASLAAPPAKKVRTTPPPDVVGISDKNPLPGSPDIVKPPEPNNNLPGLPSAPPPGFNFTFSPYQQQTAVGYQAPYVSAPVGATAGNQYPPKKFQYPGYSQTGQYHPNPNQQYRQADGIYPPPPSLNAATANQVPISRPPPPMNASFIPNVPHNLEFPQLPAPYSGLQHPNSYQQANVSHRRPLYPSHQINNNYNKISNPMPQQAPPRSFTPPIGFHRTPHHRVAMHHRMNRPPYRRDRNY